MAANEGSEDNPFSFKKFVKRTGADGGTKGGGKTEARKKSKRPTVATQDGGVPFPEEEGGENPFSFKKFVKKQTRSKGSASGSSSDDEHSFSHSLETSSTTDHPLSLPPQTNTAATFPTTTTAAGNKTSTKTKSASSRKPHSAKEPQNRVPSKQKKDNLFDDSDSDSFTSTGQDLSLPLPTSGGGGSLSADPLGLLVEPGGERDKEGVASVLRLSDSSDEESLGSLVKSQAQGSSLLGTTDPSQTDRLCSQLSAENKQLKEELAKVKGKFQKERHKNSQLQEQLQALKKKEAEETKALEDMIAKVEENLVTSTKRAVMAETTVTQLKQELQSIKVQLSQADAQSVHRHYEETLSGVRDKASYASRQLSMAAMAADQSIRELMSGVDTLKNIAEVLQFIDRISEVKQH